MMARTCIIEDNKICDNCCECNICDLDPNKACNNCAKCIDCPDYRVIEIDDIIIEPTKPHKTMMPPRKSGSNKIVK